MRRISIRYLGKNLKHSYDLRINKRLSLYRKSNASFAPMTICNFKLERLIRAEKELCRKRARWLLRGKKWYTVRFCWGITEIDLSVFNTALWILNFASQISVRLYTSLFIHLTFLSREFSLFLLFSWVLTWF